MQVSLEAKEDGKSTERMKEEENGNAKKGTTITLHMEKHGKRDSKRVDGKHSKPGHKSSRSNRDGKVQVHVKRGSEDLKRGSEDVKRGSEDLKRGLEDLKRGSEDLKRGSEDQNRKDSFKRMRTGNSVKTEEGQSKEDEFSRSGGEPVVRGKSPVFAVKNPKAMKKMAVLEFMEGHVSALGTRCLNSEQIQLNVA